MIQGSGRWAAVGIRSATNAAVSPPSLHQHRLVPGHVARGEPDRDPRQHLAVALQQPPAARRRDRLEVVRQVARPGALVGVAGELELAALHHVGGVGKGRAARARRGIVLQLRDRMRGVAAGVVEVQVGVDDPAHVAGQEPGGRPARPRAGWRPPAPRSRCRRCRGTCASSLLPSAVSISTRPSGCSTSRQRIASGMRFRSSGAIRVSQSGSGTTPNMAPPSSRCRPPSSVWQRRPPTVKRVRERMQPTPLLRKRSPPRGSVGHAPPLRAAPARRRPELRSLPGPAACARPPPAPAGAAASSSSAVTSASPGGAVAGAVLEAEVQRQVVEPAGADAPHQPARQPHRAEPRPVEREVPRPPQLGARRSPSRTGRCAPRRSARPARRAPGRPPPRSGGASRTMSLVMLVMAQMTGGIGRPGLTSDSNTTSRRPPCTTTTAISVIRSLPAGPHPGGLDVHHREGALVEQRRALRLGHQPPAAVGELADPRIGAEQRDRDPLAHRRRRARRARARRGRASTAGWRARRAARTSTRSSSVLSG